MPATSVSSACGTGEACLDSVGAAAPAFFSFVWATIAAGARAGAVAKAVSDHRGATTLVSLLRLTGGGTRASPASLQSPPGSAAGASATSGAGTDPDETQPPLNSCGVRASAVSTGEVGVSAEAWAAPGAGIHGSPLTSLSDSRGGAAGSAMDNDSSERTSGGRLGCGGVTGTTAGDSVAERCQESPSARPA